MKTKILTLLLLITIGSAYCQTFELKYLSYQSKVYNEKEGNENALKKYKNSVIDIGAVNNGIYLKENGKTFALLKYHAKYGAYFAKYEESDFSYIFKGTLSKDKSLFTLMKIIVDKVNDTELENVILIYKKVNN